MYLSSVKFVGISKYLYSTWPLAGSGYSSVIVMTASGWPIIQPSAYFGCGGRSFGSPSGAPSLTHWRIVSLSLADSRRSLRYSPCAGSACHGGIVPLLTRVAMDLAHGRASAYLSSDIGPISPVL